MKNNELLIEHLKSEIKYLKKMLSEDLTRLSNRLKDANEELLNGRVINSLGIIQSSGPMIDIKCAEISTLESTLKKLEDL